ncbi:MAG: hypothetical protein U0326_34930 [Polyangiales bacterium]
MSQDSSPHAHPSPDDLDALLARLRALPLREVRASVTLRQGVRADDAPPCVTLRGLMGERFRGLRCLTGAPRCDGCVEAPRCDFARVIGAAEAGVPGDEPRPFWMRGLTVNGFAADSVVDVSMVTVEGGREPAHGVVRRSARAPGTRPRGATLCAIEERTLSWPVVPPSTGAWRVTLRTPAVLTGDPARSRENCPAMPSLALLASAGLRRVAALVERFGGAPVDRVKMPDLRAAQVVEDSLSGWSGRRYARRQGRVVPLLGTSGHAVIRGVEEGHSAAPCPHRDERRQGDLDGLRGSPWSPRDDPRLPRCSPTT